MKTSNSGHFTLKAYKADAKKWALEMTIYEKGKTYVRGVETFRGATKTWLNLERLVDYVNESLFNYSSFVIVFPSITFKANRANNEETDFK